MRLKLVKVSLVKENTNLSIPIEISVLEEPFRPALLSVSPGYINETIFSDENLSLNFLISEIGKQKPLRNITTKLNLEGTRNLSAREYHFDKINADSSQPISFDLEPENCGNFFGKLNVNSSAGFLATDIELNVILKADINFDNEVDIFDLAIVGLCYGCMEEQECWTSEECYKADLSGNKKVDIFDLAIVGLNYGRECVKSIAV